MRARFASTGEGSRVLKSEKNGVPGNRELERTWVTQGREVGKVRVPRTQADETGLGPWDAGK